MATVDIDMSVYSTDRLSEYNRLVCPSMRGGSAVEYCMCSPLIPCTTGGVCMVCGKKRPDRNNSTAVDTTG